MQFAWGDCGSSVDLAIVRMCLLFFCWLPHKLCQRPIDAVIPKLIQVNESHTLLMCTRVLSDILMFSYISTSLSSRRVVPASASRAAVPLLVFPSRTSRVAWWDRERWAESWTCRAWRTMRQSTSWRWSSGTWSCERKRRRGWGEMRFPCQPFLY